MPDIIEKYFSDPLSITYIERVLLINASDLADIYNETSADTDIDGWMNYINLLSEEERELMAHWICVWRVSRATPPVSRWPLGLGRRQS